VANSHYLGFRAWLQAVLQTPDFSLPAEPDFFGHAGPGDRGAKAWVGNRVVYQSETLSGIFNSLKSSQIA
jgi:hypothetical protein